MTEWNGPHTQPTTLSWQVEGDKGGVENREEGRVVLIAVNQAVLWEEADSRELWPSLFGWRDANVKEREN